MQIRGHQREGICLRQPSLAVPSLAVGGSLGLLPQPVNSIACCMCTSPQNTPGTYSALEVTIQSRNRALSGVEQCDPSGLHVDTASLFDGGRGKQFAPGDHVGGERRAGERDTARDRKLDGGADRPMEGHGICERGVKASRFTSGVRRLPVGGGGGISHNDH